MSLYPPESNSHFAGQVDHHKRVTVSSTCSFCGERDSIGVRFDLKRDQLGAAREAAQRGLRRHKYLCTGTLIFTESIEDA